MGEPNEEPAPEGAEQPPATPVADTPGATPEQPLGEGGEKALKAEREARKTAERQLREAQQRLQEFEDRGKTEAEKLAERAASAEAELAESRTRLARLEAAAAAGLSLEHADRLIGSTPEELAADAKRFAETLQANRPATFDGGARQTPPEQTLDERIAEAESNGDWKVARDLKAQKLADLSTRSR